jgi:hypothetical protein
MDVQNQKTCFTLVVDDFAIKYTKLEDAQHLIDALKKDYTITIDWDATKYIGLTIEWDCTNWKVYIHMPGYLSKALLQFKHLTFKHLMPKKNKNCCIHTLHPNMEPKFNTQRMMTAPTP